MARETSYQLPPQKSVAGSGIATCHICGGQMQLVSRHVDLIPWLSFACVATMFLPIFLPVTGLAVMPYIFLTEAVLLLTMLGFIALGKKTWRCERCSAMIDR